jgi:hypothetical protein
LFGLALTVGARAGYGVAGFCFLGLFIKSRKEDLLMRQFPVDREYRLFE